METYDQSLVTHYLHHYRQLLKSKIIVCTYNHCLASTQALYKNLCFYIPFNTHQSTLCFCIGRGVWWPLPRWWISGRKWKHLYNSCRQHIQRTRCSYWWWINSHQRWNCRKWNIHQYSRLGFGLKIWTLLPIYKLNLTYKGFW